MGHALNVKMPKLLNFMNRNVIAAVAINLMPFAGIVLLGWGAFALMLLYWLENIVIGVMTLGKMLFGSWLRDSSHLFAAIPVSISSFFTTDSFASCTECSW